MTVRARCGPPGAAVLLFCLGLVPGTAAAFPDDVFNLSVGGSVMRDDNLFRIADRTDPRLLVGRAERGDTLTSAFVSLAGHKRLARQELDLALTRSAIRYTTYSLFDNDADDLSAGWRGELGHNTRFGLRLARSTSLESFGDTQRPEHNQVTRSDAAFNLESRFAPRWRAGFELGRNRTENGLESRRGGDRDSDTVQLWLRFMTRADNHVEARVRRQQLDYPNILPTVNAYNSARQTDVEVSALWRPTGASTLLATLGRRERRHQDLPARDFGANYGSLRHDWQLTGAWSLGTIVSREVGGYQDNVANYAETDSLSIRPRWLPTAKLSVNASAEVRRRRYLGSFDPSFVPRAEDTVTAFAVTGAYLPLPNLSLSLTVRDESRSSDNALLRYDARSVSAAVQYTF